MKTKITCLLATTSIWYSNFATATAIPSEPDVRFASAVQLVIREISPALQVRAHRIARERFANVFESRPELRGQNYRVITRGNEIDFYFDSREDLRQAFQQTALDFAQIVMGQVRGTGRVSFYRTDWDAQPRRFFQVVENPESGTIAIEARSVPLRNVLRELGVRLRGLSYWLPGECGDKRVSGKFEGPRGERQQAIQELARSVGLNAEVENGAYRFVGACEGQKTPPRNGLPVFVPWGAPAEEDDDPAIRPMHVMLALPPLPVPDNRY